MRVKTGGAALRVEPGNGQRPLAAAVAVLLCACASSPPAAAPPPPAPSAPRLIAALRSKVPLDPILVEGDPYSTWRDRTPPRPPPGSVCAVRFEPDRRHYRLATFASEGEARSRGFSVTHAGACGTCSTLQDLAVYLERPDLTSPVRRCGIVSGPSSAACIEELGFSRPCALTWYYNAHNTRRECFGVCVLAWIAGEPSTRPDGSLNDCLRCDEERSGPVFKAVAGRTRRNSGIESSIPRPEEEMAHVVHDYVPDDAIPPESAADAGTRGGEEPPAR